MCKNLYLLSIVFFLTLSISCKDAPLKKSVQQEYVINLTVNNRNNRTAYLYRFVSNQPQIIDSSKIIDNNVEFKGYTPHPERFAIGIESMPGSKLFVVENDSIQINASHKNLKEATISGSKLNAELDKFQRGLNKIYEKIDIQFPELQRARLDNDPDKLKQISLNIKAIEKQGVEYNFKYAVDHPNSYLSPMILNDLTKNDSIDIPRIHTTFEQFSEDIKQSSDAKELLIFLNNYK